jgi:MFS family permease
VIRRPLTILVLLTGLNLLNYLDRLVLSAVLPKVQDALHLSGFVAGSLGTIFLLGYFTTSPVFGALGDRGKRKGLIALGVLVWSVATFASGLARSPGELVAARAFVGLGEASYATLAPTIIDDITPAEKKGRWLAYFYAASPVGSALGYLVGGFADKHWGWRSAFFIAGGPGVLLALACLLIAEPERRAAKEKPHVLGALGELWKVRLYRHGALGYCAFTFAIGGFAFWAPTFLFRRYGLDLAKANFLFGLVTVIAGAIGTWVGGVFSDRATRRIPEGADRDRSMSAAALRVCFYGSLVGTPLAFLCFLVPTPNLFFLVVFFCEVALFATTSPINVVALRSVPGELRASAMALQIFAIHLLGDLWSPPAVGLLSDHFPIAIAMMSLPVAFGISALLWWVRGEAARS